MSTATIYKDNSKIIVNFEGSPLLSTILVEQGIELVHPCARKGTCGKCKVVAAGEISSPNEFEIKAGHRLSCQMRLLGDCQITLPNQTSMQVAFEIDNKNVNNTASDGMADKDYAIADTDYGIAVDIGTTTVAVVLLGLQSKKVLGRKGDENPQRAIAADVMGRIDASIKGQADILQNQIQSTLKQLMLDVCKEGKISFENQVSKMVITGNTTMLYLLVGKIPTSLATAPFEADHLFGEYIELFGKQTYLPPCMSAFVGADITTCILASKMTETDDVGLLCDIGTNGEIALWKEGQLLVTSTAAGPAFEAACIACGVGGVPGAIDKVTIKDGNVKVHTISEEKAIGICGSGLIDAIAVGLELEVVEETGAMEEDKFYLIDDIYLSAMDVRNVQLAKAAIHAGMLSLLAETKTPTNIVKTLYIAGGFGSKIQLDSAVRIGLYPYEYLEKTSVIGNAALQGAIQLLLEPELKEKAVFIANKATALELANHAVFQQQYVEQMMFFEE